MDAECPSGLGCLDGVCASIGWAAPGQPCGALARCLVGDCDYGGFGPPRPLPDGGYPTGTCPGVIPDGQPCVQRPGAGNGTTCDAFSLCFEGACILTDGVTCE